MSTKKIVYVESDYTENNKISILEKIDRLQELQDPDLMDIDYLEYFADNLGYDININKSELGDLSSVNQDNICSADKAQRYMRFAIRNLPIWYKIKTTRKSIRILLYSFGMIGDISTYYTNNYLPESEGGKWIVPDFTMKSDSLVNIPKEFYPTSHFGIWVDLNLSENNLNWETAKREQIVNAIESIRPANTVFRKLGGYINTSINSYISMYTRFHSRYIKLPSNGDSDYWHPIDVFYSNSPSYSSSLMELTQVGSGITNKEYTRLKIKKIILIATGGSNNIRIRMKYINPITNIIQLDTIFPNRVGSGTHEIEVDYNFLSNINIEMYIDGGDSSGSYELQLY